MDIELLIDFFTDWSGIDVHNTWAFLPQIFVLLPMIWFSFISFRVIAKEIKAEHNQQGSIPILAFIYMCFAIIYSIIFIRNFGEIINYNHYKILSILTPQEDPTFYVLTIKILTVSTLVAFTFNFYKSFFTLNSLEFGLLNNVALKSLFNSKKSKAIVEGIIRFVIAFLFIMLEKKLAFLGGTLHQPINPDALHFQENDFILIIGLLAVGLYSFIILWTLIFNFWLDKKDNKNTIPSGWYKLSYWQFGFGLLVGLTLIFLGKFVTMDTQCAKFLLIAILAISVLSSIGVVATIVINECINECKKWTFNGTTAAV